MNEFDRYYSSPSFQLKFKGVFPKGELVEDNGKYPGIFYFAQLFSVPIFAVKPQEFALLELANKRIGDFKVMNIPGKNFTLSVMVSDDFVIFQNQISPTSVIQNFEKFLASGARLLGDYIFLHLDATPELEDQCCFKTPFTGWIDLQTNRKDKFNELVKVLSGPNTPIAIKVDSPNRFSVCNHSVTLVE